jgi:hypothetical protein
VFAVKFGIGCAAGTGSITANVAGRRAFFLSTPRQLFGSCQRPHVGPFLLSGEDVFEDDGWNVMRS